MGCMVAKVVVQRIIGSIVSAILVTAILCAPAGVTSGRRIYCAMLVAAIRTVVAILAAVFLIVNVLRNLILNVLRRRGMRVVASLKGALGVAVIVSSIRKVDGSFLSTR